MPARSEKFEHFCVFARETLRGDYVRNCLTFLDNNYSWGSPMRNIKNLTLAERQKSELIFVFASVSCFKAFKLRTDVKQYFRLTLIRHSKYKMRFTLKMRTSSKAFEISITLCTFEASHWELSKAQSYLNFKSKYLASDFMLQVLDAFYISQIEELY